MIPDMGLMALPTPPTCRRHTITVVSEPHTGFQDMIVIDNTIGRFRWIQR